MTMERKFRNPSCIPQRVCVEESNEKCCDRSEKMKEQVLNRIYFFFFLVSTVFGILFWHIEAQVCENPLYLFLKKITNLTIEKDVLAEITTVFGPSVPQIYTGFLGFFRFIMTYRRSIVVISIYLIVHLVFLCLLITEQLHGITRNLTTIELANIERHPEMGERYRKMYDKGEKENAMMFFGLKEDVNWFDLNFNLLED